MQIIIALASLRERVAERIASKQVKYRLLQVFEQVFDILVIFFFINSYFLYEQYYVPRI